MQRLRRFLVVLAFFLPACGSVTRVITPIPQSPLSAIVTHAAPEFEIEWIDQNTLELTKSLPRDSGFFDSIPLLGGLGRGIFRAQLYHSRGQLYAQFYRRLNPPFTLYLPIYRSTKDGGLFVECYMQQQMRRILAWAGSEERNERSAESEVEDIREVASRSTP